ncbi:MAG: tyrosine-type recombinase/integrase [bacterium]
MNKTVYYSSIFAEEIKGYIDEKRAVGYKFEKGISILKRLDIFFINHNLDEKNLSKELVLMWIAKKPNESDSNRSGRISIIRGFARYLVRIGQKAYIVPDKILKISRYSYTPYIFSKEELKKIFLEADSYSISVLTPNRHLILALIFRLLYGTGLRISEALKLKNADVDLHKGILIIKEAKFGKERLVPLSESLLVRCQNYLNAIHQSGYSGEYFFPSPYGGYYENATIYNHFRDIIWKAGISHSGDGPRMHDLRHTFAVHCLKNWVLKGEDLTNLLPYLSVYLGHSDLRGTQHYLKLTADLYPTIIADVESHFSYLIPEVIFHETD